MSKKNSHETAALRRLQQEVAQMLHDKDGITQSTGGRLHIFPCEEDRFCFQAVIAGPESSPYRQGIFTVRILVPENYPFQAPEFYFETTIWHPNVDIDTGKVVLDCFVDKWTPAWTLQSLLLAVFSALEDPVVDDDPGNEDAAIAWRENRQWYWNQAEYMTFVHAGTGSDGRIKRFVDMGFDQEQARQALMQCGWNEEEALDHLMLQLSYCTSDDKPPATRAPQTLQEMENVVVTEVTQELSASALGDKCKSAAASPASHSRPEPNQPATEPPPLQNNHVTFMVDEVEAEKFQLEKEEETATVTESSQEPSSECAPDDKSPSTVAVAAANDRDHDREVSGTEDDNASTGSWSFVEDLMDGELAKWVDLGLDVSLA